MPLSQSRAQSGPEAGRRRLRLPIRRKLLAAFMAVFIIPLLVIAVYVRIWTERSLTERALDDVIASCTESARTLKRALEGPREDVLFLTSSPDVIALAGALAGTDEGMIEASRAVVEGLFLAFSRNRAHYAQVRFIDHTGGEIVRVDSDGRRVWAVPRDQLQPKGERYYFKKAISVPSGHVYVSPLDLNRERGEIERPLNPVIRYATPVFVGPDPIGVVVTNVSATPFLDQIRGHGGEAQGRQVLVDQDGFYLAHPVAEKEWGGPKDLNSGQRLWSDYGELAAPVLSSKSGTLDTGERVVCFEALFPCPWDEDRYWVLVHDVSKAVALAPVRHFRLLIAGVFGVSLVAALALSLYLSRRLSDPLRELERGAELLAAGVFDHRVDVQTGDEIEVLARAYNQAAERLSEARSQEQLTLVGRMAASIVHDIKNPLTSIRGFADVLATTDGAAEREEFSGIIRQDTDRILSMIQELLEFSRGEPADLHLERIPIADFFAQLQPLLERDMEQAGLQLALHVTDQANVRLDIPRMTRVFLNLASNAREAMEEGGGSLSIEAVRSKETVQIAVQDSGPGIPEVIRDSLFEPFVTRGKTGGTGLGLAIAKQVVEAHGGAIVLDPDFQDGARFLIRLPVANAFDEDTEGQGREAPALN